MSKAPAFQLYAADFMADPLVDAMSPEELGGYFRLLLVAWQQPSPGYLPADEYLLAAWSRLGTRWKKCGAAIMRCFRQTGDGRVFQKRMVEVAANQGEYRETQRQKGIASANARKDRNHVQPRLMSGCSTVPTEAQPDTQPEGNSPSPSPSPSENLKDSTPGTSDFTLEAQPANPKPKRIRKPKAPKPEDDPPPFKLTDGLATLAMAGRFTPTPLDVGATINAYKLVRAWPDISLWKLAGEWLAAGGEHWKQSVDCRHLSELPTWIVHAVAWDKTGRQPIRTNSARASPELARPQPPPASQVTGIFHDEDTCRTD